MSKRHVGTFKTVDYNTGQLPVLPLEIKLTDNLFVHPVSVRLPFYEHMFYNILAYLGKLCKPLFYQRQNRTFAQFRMMSEYPCVADPHFCVSFS